MAIVCPDCQVRFKVTRREKSYKTPCLSCERPIRVPGTAAGARDLKPAARQPAKRRKGTRNNVFRAMARPTQQTGPVIPLLPFLSALSFPWYPEVVWRWVVLSGGCSAVGFLFVAVTWSFLSGIFTAAYALCFPFGWLSIFTFSYLAASSTAIITETAYGNDRIGDWPEADWRDWFSELLHYVPALLAAFSIAYGLAYLASLLAGLWWQPAGPVEFPSTAWLIATLIFWGTLFLFLFLLAPIFLMSVIDDNTTFAFLTAFVVTSLAKRWWVWLRFYTVAAGVGILWPGTLIVGFPFGPFYTTLVTGPLMAAAMLIYARLMGRLALLCSQ